MDVDLLVNRAEPHTNLLCQLLSLYITCYLYYTPNYPFLLLPETGHVSLALSGGSDYFPNKQNFCLITMPPKRSKRIAQKSGQADQPPAAALTPEEIFVALA